ncbi:MAG: tRNA glutamyl-Q(34) synthetase GluQRS [Gammaproteobacteria bacterium]|nr:tRNA glutamyl-Q(34) synthetase GluQRS [Gammaproteobacteria bacterium]
MPDNNTLSYTGRFAPSPTGPVHFGTLVAAVGSYLQAKINNGKWLLRMEDVDTTRKVEGADTDILHTLEAFGFEWHGEIIYQSKQTEYYQQVLDTLISQSLVFPCTCSRKQLAETNSKIYPGTCRRRHLPEKKQHALRILAQDINIGFVDKVMGKQSQNIKTQCGDFVIQRRDGLFAYQLAVVADDALQSITEVVRGADLLDSTARQIYLQQCLHYPSPDYCHLPLVVDANGAKISKSAGAARVTIKNRQELLVAALAFLGQQPPTEINNSDITDIWRWAIAHWRVDRVPHQTNPAFTSHL